MRKLVAIGIAGIAIVVIVLHFVRSPSETVAPASATVTDTHARPPEQQPQAPKQGLAVSVTNARAQPPATAPKTSRPAAAPLTAEQQQQAACNALSERRMAREKSARDAEPKDPAWAYPMEQKLREYLTQKLQSGQLEVTGIDCKTTFCEIKALVLGPEASTEFQGAISAAANKPWNDFTGSATSLSEESGKTVYFGQLRRAQFEHEIPQPPEEAQTEAACTARVAAQQKRERAARDTQPQDTSWAEPMEQLLRQHLTKEMAKHPVERIDIDCRTTFCKIEAKGRTNDAYLAFQKVAQTVADEPWANLRNGEGGGSSYGESWKQQYLLYRR
jgi:hypothetical protein